MARKKKPKFINPVADELPMLTETPEVLPAETKPSVEEIKADDNHHYINGGSSIKRRILCHGSAEQETKYGVNYGSDDASYGTFIHKGIELALPNVMEKKRLDFTLPPTYKPDDVILVEQALENILSIVGDKLGSIGWASERKYVLNHELELGGSADFSYAYREKGKNVGGVWDYKNGTVETDIIQTILYLVSMQHELGYKFDILRGHIYQPHSLDDQVTQFVEITREEAAEYIEKFTEIAKINMGHYGRSKMTLTPGEVQCRFCSATATCPAVHKQTRERLQTVLLQEETLPDPDTLPAKVGDENIVRWLGFSEYIKQVDKAMWTYAFNRFQAGNPIPGTKGTYGRTNRKWDDSKDVKQIANMLMEYGATAPIKESLVGIGEITKQLKAAKIPQKDIDVILEGLTVKPAPALAVVLDNEDNAHRITLGAPTATIFALIQQETT